MSEKKEARKKFILSDRAYNAMKWCGLLMVPLGTLLTTLAGIWHDATELNAIGATLSAVGVFIGSCVAISNKNYAEEPKGEE